MRALAALLGVASAAVVLSLLGELFARHVLRSTHVVYFLVGRSKKGAQGTVLYVGETTNHVLRYRQHLDRDEYPDPWRERVDNMAVVRYTWGLRQAERVERRMIRSISLAARWRMCPPIHNHQHNVYARGLPGGGQRWPAARDAAWLVVYRLNGVAWPSTRWHKPNPAGWALSPAGVESNGVGDVWEAPTARRSRSGPTVTYGDGPQVAPLGALTAGDMSPAGDTVVEPSPVPLPAAPALRVVPDGEDDLPAEEPARTRERNRRNQQRRRQAAKAGQDRAAG